MPHYGTLRQHDFSQDAADDIRNSTVYGANDDKIGTIDDIVFDHGSGDLKYAVVKTGHWPVSKKFLVPAGRLRSYKDEDSFKIDLTKDQFESRLPEFDEDKLRSDKDWDAYESESRRAWQADPVQHRTDRLDLDVTPATVTPNEAAPTTGAPLGSLGEELHSLRSDGSEEELAREDRAGEFTPRRMAGKFPEAQQSENKIHPVPAGEDALDESVALNNEFPVDVNPPANPTQSRAASTADVGVWHPRMRRFEEVLRKNRVDITASCASCKAAPEKAA